MLVALESSSFQINYSVSHVLFLVIHCLVFGFILMISSSGVSLLNRNNWQLALSVL